nr:metallophosphoesterase [Lutibaculum baratangense]
MYRLAHLSDPHIPPSRRPRRRELLFSQRLVGWTNWRRSRRDVHRREVLDVLTGDLEREAPDHIAVTGDLTIVSSRAEWTACREWLNEIGHGDHVSLVPGNHDAYTRGAVPATRRAWREYMTGDGADPDESMARFPYLRRRGPLALVGVSSAVATAPFLATGKIGSSQLERLETMLAELRSADLFRVVLIHHPPLRTQGDRYRRLLDGKHFVEMVGRLGAELVLHGHDHTSTVRHIESPREPVPVIGVPSASALAFGGKPAAAYNVYEIDRGRHGWNCTMSVRGFEDEAISETQRRPLWRDGHAVVG